MNFKNYIFSLILFLSILLISCRKNAGNPQWDVDALVPLAGTTLTLNQISNQFITSSGAGNQLSLVFNNDVYNFTLENIIDIPDTSVVNVYPLPPLTATPGFTLPPIETQTTFNVQGAELNKVIIKSGFVKFEARSQIHERTRMVYEIPKAVKAGITFKVTVDVPAATGSSDGLISGTYDLSGYEIDLRGKSGSKVNTVYSTLTTSIPNDANSVTISLGQALTITNSFIDIVPYYAHGYFGNVIIDVPPAKTHVDFFKKIISGKIQLGSISMNLHLQNNIGIDASTTIHYLSAMNSVSGDSVSLTHTIIGNLQHINRAIENPFAPYTYSVLLDNSNSNAKTMMECLPDYFGYAMEVEINPLGNVSGGADFIYYDKGLRASIDMEIPLSLGADKLTMTDTVNFSIKESKSFDQIKGGNLNLDVHNKFPFSGFIKLFLLGENNLLLDSLGGANTFDAATIDTDSIVRTVKDSKIIFPIDDSKIDHLVSSGRIAFVVQFSTVPSHAVLKIYKDYKMDLKLVGDFTYRIE